MIIDHLIHPANFYPCWRLVWATPGHACRCYASALPSPYHRLFFSSKEAADEYIRVLGSSGSRMMVPYYVPSRAFDPRFYGEWEVAIWTDLGDGKDMFCSSDFRNYRHTNVNVEGVLCPVLAW